MAPALILGIGLGGFVDGIVMHQILQWHHMVSGEVTAGSLAGLEDNTLADGVFHAVTWTVTLVGSVVALRAWRRGDLAPPWRVHAGGLLAGWGIFNLVEGLVDHQLLGIHHVREGDAEWAYDAGFLLFGAALLAAGLRLARRR